MQARLNAAVYWARTEKEREEWDDWCRLHEIPVGDRITITFVPEGPVQVVVWPDYSYEVNMKALPPPWVLR